LKKYYPEASEWSADRVWDFGASGLIKHRVSSQAMPHVVTIEGPLYRENLTRDAGAIAFGVTNELSTMYPYGISQQWASALSAAGFEGIKYRSRFDTRDHILGLAIFDKAGAHKWASNKVCDGNTPQIFEILAQLGISVLSRPLLKEMTIL
jgi:hypothetical protein